MDTLSYKGFTGSIEFSSEDNMFYGKVLGYNHGLVDTPVRNQSQQTQKIKSLISYEGKTLKELKTDFHNAVNDYLSLNHK